MLTAVTLSFFVGRLAAINSIGLIEHKLPLSRLWLPMAMLV